MTTDAPQVNSGTPDGPASQSVPLQRKRCGICGEPLAGKQAKWCSDACRWKAWDADNPRRPRLNFDVQPAPPAAAGQPYLAARLWLLGRLQSGPVSTLDLRREPWPASQNPAQRVLELRNLQHDIRTVRRGRTTWYVLWVDGVPAAGEPA